jgi:hypothetical protein
MCSGQGAEEGQDAGDGCRAVFQLVGKRLGMAALGMAADAFEEVTEVGALKPHRSWSKACNRSTTPPCHNHRSQAGAKRSSAVSRH